MDGDMIDQDLLARAAQLKAGSRPGNHQGRRRLAATVPLILALAGATAGCSGTAASVATPVATASPTGPAAASATASSAGAAAQGSPVRTRPAARAGSTTAGQAGSPSAGQAVPASGPATTSPAAGSAPTADTTYLAEGQNPRGTIVRAPGCASGCVLSGDATSILYNMTWSAWTATEAVGRGTENLEGCNPTCASGAQYRVAVTVTFSDPAKDCAAGHVRWLWTKATFTYPNGLPSALRGQNAPLNPWTFSALKDELASTCS
jgi:hypothetical protein